MLISFRYISRSRAAMLLKLICVCVCVCVFMVDHKVPTLELSRLFKDKCSSKEEKVYRAAYG